MYPKTQNTTKHESTYLKHTPLWSKNMQAYCLPNQTHPVVDLLCIPKVLSKTTRALPISHTIIAQKHASLLLAPLQTPTRVPMKNPKKWTKKHMLKKTQKQKEPSLSEEGVPDHLLNSPYLNLLLIVECLWLGHIFIEGTFAGAPCC